MFLLTLASIPIGPMPKMLSSWMLFIGLYSCRDYIGVILQIQKLILDASYPTISVCFYCCCYSDAMFSAMKSKDWQIKTPMIWLPFGSVPTHNRCHNLFVGANGWWLPGCRYACPCIIIYILYNWEVIYFGKTVHIYIDYLPYVQVVGYIYFCAGIYLLMYLLM